MKPWRQQNLGGSSIRKNYVICDRVYNRKAKSYTQIFSPSSTYLFLFVDFPLFSSISDSSTNKKKQPTRGVLKGKDALWNFSFGVFHEILI